MARINPEVERLQREVDLLRKLDAARRQDPRPYPLEGCGDHSCDVRTPTGMATNGGCWCDEHTVRRALRWWKRYAKWLEDEMVEQRDYATRLESELKEREQAEEAGTR